MKTVLMIKRYLGERCLTQKEAAAMCGLSPQAFSRIVTGKEPPYPLRGQRIADALDWDGDWQELFDRIEVG